MIHLQVSFSLSPPLGKYDNDYQTSMGGLQVTGGVYYRVVLLSKPQHEEPDFVYINNRGH